MSSPARLALGRQLAIRAAPLATLKAG